jgi:hypothetical protein
VWLDDEIPFHRSDYFQNSPALRRLLDVSPTAIDMMESKYVSIGATKSTVADVREVAMAQAHLTEQQRNELHEVLSKYNKLFDGKQGCYPHRKFHIDLKPGAVPFHCKRPYPVPQRHAKVFRDELKRQCDQGVLEQVYDTEWGMPMMAIPKKDGTIRTVDDFRELNKWVQRKQYPLPRIQDIFQRRRGYKFFTKIDITGAYYSYELDEESSWLCVLVTPFGKYRRKRAPQGLTQSPDWAQGAIEEVLKDLLYDCVEAFIDDVGIFSNDWDHHIRHIDEVLSRLEANGYTVNPAKCEWGVRETDWLGHWLTPEGIKPWKKKIDGILALDKPKTLKQLRGFIGMVNYYRDFWKRRAHVLAPLTALTKVNPKQFRKAWDAKCDQAFKQIKAIIAQEVLLAYPDPNKLFDVETDSSDYQLGARIMQEGKTIALFSRKLTDAQTRYPASDKEALCITAVLEEFRPMLYGASIRIFTDRRNLTRTVLKLSRLLHWRLLVFMIKAANSLALHSKLL